MKIFLKFILITKKKKIKEYIKIGFQISELRMFIKKNTKQKFL